MNNTKECMSEKSMPWKSVTWETSHISQSEELNKGMTPQSKELNIHQRKEGSQYHYILSNN
jgi:hypothetical protein